MLRKIEFFNMKGQFQKMIDEFNGIIKTNYWKAGLHIVEILSLSSMKFLLFSKLFLVKIWLVTRIV